MTGRVMASRIGQLTRGFTAETLYDKHMVRLSNRIFNEVIQPTDVKSMKVVRVMSAEPLEQRADKSVEYYPNLPMFHYLTKLLRLHGLLFDEHVVWREVQDQLNILRGKVVKPKPGEGKRAQLRKN